MKRISIAVLETIALLAAIDVLILMASLAQVALGEPMGHWSPFWASQAKVVLAILGK